MLGRTFLDRFLGRTRSKGPRRYITPKLGVAGFFRALNQAGISYVVLRWFESLPAMEPGEDIDLLVADEDLARLDAFLDGTQRGGIPCDIYTVSGLPGTDYCGIAYYPPILAGQLLDSAEMGPNGVRAPDARHYLLSMAYHVLYHKGYLAGLPAVAGEKPHYANPEHDYAEVLPRLAQNAGAGPLCAGELNMSALLDFLKANSWQAPHDTLEKLARENNWIHDAFLADKAADPSWDGLEVFVVRERGLEFVPLIRDELQAEGFSLLHEERISSDAKESFTTEVRGGHWDGRGPYASGAGGPAYVLVMLDLFPRQPAKALVEQFYGLANERTYQAKLRVRRVVNARLESHSHCNAVHSSDNPRQALHYFSMLQSTTMDRARLAHAVRQLRDKTAVPWPVKRVIGQPGRHAIKRVVIYEDAPVICKTFRPGGEQYLERELLARKLAAGMPGVLPILAREGLHLLFPSFAPARRSRFLAAGEMARMRRVIRHFRREGYELTDFTPDNVIRDRDQGLLALDFDSLESGTPSDGVVGCRCWYGMPREYRPRFRAKDAAKDSGYYRFWYDRTGLPRWMAAREVPSWIVPPTQFAVRASFAAKQVAKTWRNAFISALRRPQ